MPRTLTVGDIRRLIDGLPDEQAVMILDEDGMAAVVTEIHPETITDENPKGYGRVLLLDFDKSGDWFGFDSKTETKIDTRDD